MSPSDHTCCVVLHSVQNLVGIAKCSVVPSFIQTCVRCHVRIVTRCSAALDSCVFHRVLRNPPPRTTAATQQAPQASSTQMMRVCLLLLGCSAANAHGRLTVPRPRPALWAEPGMQGHTDATAIYRWNEPVFTLNRRRHPKTIAQASLTRRSARSPRWSRNARRSRQSP